MAGRSPYVAGYSEYADAATPIRSDNKLRQCPQTDFSTDWCQSLEKGWGYGERVGGGREGGRRVHGATIHGVHKVTTNNGGIIII